MYKNIMSVLNKSKNDKMNLLSEFVMKRQISPLGLRDGVVMITNKKTLCQVEETGYLHSNLPFSTAAPKLPTKIEYVS